MAVSIENTRLIADKVKSAQLASIGQMASTIIHDIKNPMGSIRGFAELIALKTPENQKYSDIICDEIDRLVDMTKELLEFSKGKTSINIQSVNVEQYIKGVASFLERDFAKSNINLHINVDYQGNVDIAPDKMRRVIFNIANNARDAMKTGGDIYINLYKEADNFVIELKDNGPGIPEEIRDKLFEPFVTHGKSQGTGLGMAVTKQIVEAHKGSISFDSKHGKGTTFYIKIPISTNS